MYDVVIIGGGPAGSTVSTLLKLIRPESKVLVLEREVFPREHVGESLLPAIMPILEEMKVWDEIEAQGFPIKTGAMYRWGSDPGYWRLDFLVGEKFVENPRPEKMTGQRRKTTFHVERAIYDKVLLDHAERTGVEVRQGVKVVEILREGDRVTGLRLESGETVEATYYVDASGHAGTLRRSMGVQVDEPTKLKNIAIWNYWKNDEWAQTVNKGGIRARILSVGYGWIWYLPISANRSSIGLVTHAEYFKSTGKKPEELYGQALSDEPFLAKLLENAERIGSISTTKDWSFSAERLSGENWFLAGESAGFADPILAAGMTLTHVGSRELAYTLKALLNSQFDPQWLKDWYSTLSLRRIRQHIRFADFWYSANSHWEDLKAYSAEIAKDAGLNLDPDEGFRWLSTGGFASDNLSSSAVGSYDLTPAKCVLQRLTGKPAHWEINRFNEFRLNLVGAQEVKIPIFRDGEIEQVKCYQRGSRLLPITGNYLRLIGILQEHRDMITIVSILRQAIGAPPGTYHPILAAALDILEGMITEGWVTAKLNKKRPMMQVKLSEDSFLVSAEHEPFAALGG